MSQDPIIDPKMLKGLKPGGQAKQRFDNTLVVYHEVGPKLIGVKQSEWHYGMPMPEQYYQEHEELVYFDSGKSEIKSEFYAELDKVAAHLIQNPEVQITISGYTDTVGSRASNQILSEQRVDAVLQYLQKEKHVPLSQMRQEQIVISAEGENNLRVQTRNSVANAQNRCVEIGFKYSDPNVNSRLQRDIIHVAHYTDSSENNRQCSSGIVEPGKKHRRGINYYLMDEDIQGGMTVPVDAENMYEQRFYVLCGGKTKTAQASFNPKTNVLTLYSDSYEEGSSHPIAVFPLTSSEPIDPTKLQIGAMDWDGNIRPMSLGPSRGNSPVSAQISVPTDWTPKPAESEYQSQPAIYKPPGKNTP